MPSYNDDPARNVRAIFVANAILAYESARADGRSGSELDLARETIADHLGHAGVRPSERAGALGVDLTEYKQFMGL